MFIFLQKLILIYFFLNEAKMSDCIQLFPVSENNSEIPRYRKKIVLFRYILLWTKNPNISMYFVSIGVISEV